MIFAVSDQVQANPVWHGTLALVCQAKEQNRFDSISEIFVEGHHALANKLPSFLGLVRVG